MLDPARRRAGSLREGNYLMRTDRHPDEVVVVVVVVIVLTLLIASTVTGGTRRYHSFDDAMRCGLCDMAASIGTREPGGQAAVLSDVKFIG